MTRNAWRQIAANAMSLVVEVETICSDEGEHRRRVDTRTGDITGLPLPTWQQVAGRDYEAWNRAHIVIDTAIHTEISPQREITTPRCYFGFLGNTKSAFESLEIERNNRDIRPFLYSTDFQ
jgi:hypothetical protein